MYLVRTISGDSICETAEEVKAIPRNEVLNLYSLTSVDYDTIVLNAIIQNCILKYLKGNQYPKRDVIEFTADSLGVRKAAVSKVIAAMEKEKLIYIVKKSGPLHDCIGIHKKVL